MRRLGRIAIHVPLFITLLVILLVSNILLVACINIQTENSRAYVKVGEIASHLTQTAQGYEMDETGISMIDSYGGFAMVIGNDGAVWWEYLLPDELPREYTLSQAAVFSRYYLMDYPVYTRVLEDGLLVVGLPQHTVWKYHIELNENTIRAYAWFLPLLLAGDLLVLIFVPLAWRRRREQGRTAWIAGVSHDIRTPLSLVLGHAAALREGKDGSAHAQVIEEQALRIRTLIANLNTENKLSYGMGRWNMERINFCALLRESLCDLLNRGLPDCYEAQLDIADGLEPCLLKGDRELLRRLLDNLLDNAVAHNPQGCHIFLSLKKEKFGRVMLTIEDDGRGVTPSQLKNFRKPLSMRKLPEHGLGIRLVREIAALHHWRISFANRAGGGLRVSIIVFSLKQRLFCVVI